METALDQPIDTSRIKFHLWIYPKTKTLLSNSLQVNGNQAKSNFLVFIYMGDLISTGER